MAAFPYLGTAGGVENRFSAFESGLVAIPVKDPDNRRGFGTARPCSGVRNFIRQVDGMELFCGLSRGSAISPALTFRRGAAIYSPPSTTPLTKFCILSASAWTFVRRKSQWSGIPEAPLAVAALAVTSRDINIPLARTSLVSGGGFMRKLSKRLASSTQGVERREVACWFSNLQPRTQSAAATITMNDRICGLSSRVVESYCARSTLHSTAQRQKHSTPFQRLSLRSAEALRTRVSFALIAPSLLAFERKEIVKTYDGAAVMFGEHGGLHFHRYAHKFNLNFSQPVRNCEHRKTHICSVIYKICIVCSNRPSSPYGDQNTTGRGRGSVVVRPLASHLCEPGSIPGGVAPGFSHIGFVPDAAVGDFPFPPAIAFRRRSIPYSPHFTLIGSHDSGVKSRQIPSTVDDGHEVATRICGRHASQPRAHLHTTVKTREPTDLTGTSRAPRHSKTTDCRLPACRRWRIQIKGNEGKAAASLVLTGEAVSFTWLYSFADWLWKRALRPIGRATKGPLLAGMPAGNCSEEILAALTSSGVLLEVNMEQRRNEKGGGGGDGRSRENPPTSGIVRHDSRMRKSESGPAEG
ncbi:hypothetical protein PR048_004913 [Dryococelus australis]|uniref:Uncharacterized protein n=1 Tax=Dryococelus australis TaxID=614101 RepID=A0ABQ9I6R2_9NEOP|nr:hypothetical protein PR048_004913 [Dryococelus australis]